MHILYITPFLPFPPVNGGRTRFLSFVQHMRKMHRITIAGLFRDIDQKHFKWYSDHHIDTLLERRLQPFEPKGIAKIGQSRSVYLGLYSSPTLRTLINRLVKEEDIDLVHVICSYMLPNVPHEVTAHYPLIIEEPNLESIVLQQQATMVGWPYDFLLKHEARRLETMQSIASNLADVYVCSSPDDASVAKGWASKNGSEKIRIVENGVDVNKYRFDITSRSPLPIICFLANFSYYPNIDAIEYFVHKCFPEVCRQIPQITLRILGYQSEAKLAHLQRDNVLLQDYRSDISADLAQAWLSICPLRMGSGSHIKILESMAVGTPVLTSTVGASGLPIKDRQHAIIASPEMMAEAIINLIQDSLLRTVISRNARDLVESKMTWEHASVTLETIYNELRP